jgi:phosphodiesterase/alkaline phosphatase D-like protein
MFKRILFTAMLFGIILLSAEAQSSKQCLKFLVSPEIKNTTDSSVVIVWQTNQPTNAQIVIYTQTERKIVDIEEMNEKHEIVINELLPDTVYFYRIIASSGTTGIVTPLKITQTAVRILKKTEEELTDNNQQ